MKQISKTNKTKLSKFNFFGIDYPIRYKNESIYTSYIGISFSFLMIFLFNINKIFLGVISRRGFFSNFK